MTLVDKKNNYIDISISLDELLIINNSLNEVCNGLDQFEFETRMGATKDNVKSLLHEINLTIDKIEVS